MKCPECGSPYVQENLLYGWSAKCNKCGWFTSDYKPGPISKNRWEQLQKLEGKE